MADRAWRRASVRTRTTAAAVLVVALALAAGALILVALVRDSLRDGAEERASALAAQFAATGVPAVDDEDDGDDDLIWQVRDATGAVRSSVPLATPLAGDGEQVRIAGADHPYVVAAETGASGQVVTVAVSLEDVDESTSALAGPLAVGLPLLLLLVGGTTWLVVGRALAPVERIRREVEDITGDRLARRVYEPPSHDEISRLARTMNRMLGRLADSRDRQQRFVADASHELRSPLASIRQAAEVSRSHPDALPAGELAGAVLDESARMQRLVEQLLLLTRADAAVTGPRRDVDLDDLAMAEARRIARTGLRVVTSGIGGGRVTGDPAALSQVVRNLVDNAARHARGTVAVSVTESPGRVELVVEDDGPGIPEADRERVFDRFVRLDEARARDEGGSGLGLAIVREIATAHGATVTVATSGLGGARVQVGFRTGPAL